MPLKLPDGLLQEADLSKINLAYPLEDGQKLYVPNIHDSSPENSISNDSYISDESGNNVIMDNISASDNLSTNNKPIGGNTMININSASESELQTLPGIGPSTASKIIEYRNENGKFSTIEDIQNVKGIGDSKFSSIKDLICVK